MPPAAPTWPSTLIIRLIHTTSLEPTLPLRPTKIRSKTHTLPTSNIRCTVNPTAHLTTPTPTTLQTLGHPLVYTSTPTTILLRLVFLLQYCAGVGQPPPKLVVVHLVVQARSTSPLVDDKRNPTTLGRMCFTTSHQQTPYVLHATQTTNTSSTSIPSLEGSEMVSMDMCSRLGTKTINAGW